MTPFIIPVWFHVAAQWMATLYIFASGDREERIGSGYLVGTTLVAGAIYYFHITNVPPNILLEPFDALIFRYIMIR
jgi:hypothetical protein